MVEELWSRTAGILFKREIESADWAVKVALSFPTFCLHFAPVHEVEHGL